MDNIKILLTIQLEGGTLVRKSEPEVIHYQLTKHDLDPRIKGKEGFKIAKKGKVKYFPLEAKPASLCVNIGQEAFKYMTSKECPHWQRTKTWLGMSAKQRLEAHLQRMCEYHHGKSYRYQILEDK